MENEENVLSRPWYRHPAVAIIAGILTAGGTVAACMASFQFIGGAAILCALFVAPVLAGFVVGLLVGRNGFLWAAVTGLAFVIAFFTIASLMSSGFGLRGLGSALGTSLAPIAIGGLFGAIGEAAAKSRARTLAWIGGFVIAAGMLIVGLIWWRQAAIVKDFKRTQAPILEKLIVDKVVRRPASVHWDVGRRRYTLGEGGGLEIRARGQRYYLSYTLEAGGPGFYLRYNANRQVRITDLQSARNYMKSLGFRDTVVDRLELGGSSEAVYTTWFNIRDLASEGIPASWGYRDKRIRLSLDEKGSITSSYESAY